MKKQILSGLALAFVVYSTTASAIDRRPNSKSPIRNNKIFGVTSVDKGKNFLIGTSGLFLGKIGKPLATVNTGPEIQDITVGLAGTIDNYFSGKIYLENFQNLASLPAGFDMIREAYGKTMAIPVIAFKMGKFLADFGENNQVYPHAQPMVDKPLMMTELFGRNGFASVGAEMDIEIPTPWKFDLSFAVLSSRLAVTTFGAAGNENLVGTARMRHEFDVTDQVNLIFGISTAYGNNSATGASNNATTMFGTDFTFKFNAAKDNMGFGLAWYNEFIYSRRAGYAAALGGEKITGFYTNPMFRFNPKFWMGLRFDYVGRSDINDKSLQESLMFAYVPSDVTRLSLQGGVGQNDIAGSTWLVQLQYALTLGDLPGHAL